MLEFKAKFMRPTDIGLHLRLGVVPPSRSRLDLVANDQYLEVYTSLNH